MKSEMASLTPAFFNWPKQLSVVSRPSFLHVLHCNFQCVIFNLCLTSPLNVHVSGAGAGTVTIAAFTTILD